MLGFAHGKSQPHFCKDMYAFFCEESCARLDWFNSLVWATYVFLPFGRGFSFENVSTCSENTFVHSCVFVAWLSSISCAI